MSPARPRPGRARRGRRQQIGDQIAGHEQVRLAPQVGRDVLKRHGLHSAALVLQRPHHLHKVAVAGRQQHPVNVFRLQQRIHRQVQVGVGLAKAVAVFVGIPFDVLLDHFVAKVAQQRIEALLRLAIGQIDLSPVGIDSSHRHSAAPARRCRGRRTRAALRSACHSRRCASNWPRRYKPLPASFGRVPRHVYSFCRSLNIVICVRSPRPCIPWPCPDFTPGGRSASASAAGHSHDLGRRDAQQRVQRPAAGIHLRLRQHRRVNQDAQRAWRGPAAAPRPPGSR